MSTLEVVHKVSAPGLSAGRRAWIPQRGEIHSITELRDGVPQTAHGSAYGVIPLPQVGEYVQLAGDTDPCYFLGWLETNDGDALRALVADRDATRTFEVTRPAPRWDARYVCVYGQPYLEADRILDLMTSVWKTAGTRNGQDVPEQGGDARVTKAYQRGRREAEAEAKERLDALIRDAHVWADDNNICSVFEEWCETHGFEGREHDYSVTVRLEVDIDMTYHLSGPLNTSRAADEFAQEYDEHVLLNMVTSGDITSDQISVVSRYVSDVNED